MAEMEGYQKIAKLFKQTVETLSTKQLSVIKIYFNNLGKQIAAGDDKLLSEFKDVRDMLNSIKEAKGKLPIHYTVASGQLEVLKYLIETFKVDYEVKDKEGNSPFFTAIQHGHFAIVKFFVQELGMSPFCVKDGEIGALHVAANTDNVQLLEYFIGKGCDIEKISIEGKPINWAVGSNSTEAAKFLLQKGADANGDVTCSIPAPIILAVDFGNEQLYEALINATKPANLNVKDPEGYSLLHLAAEKGNLPLVKQLIEKGQEATLEVKGKTPLALAFENGKWEIVSQLRKFTKNHQQIEKKLKTVKEQKQKQSPAPVDKNRAEQIKNEGNKFFVDKKYTEALAKYQQAVSYDPENDALHRNLAACYLNLGKYAQALTHCHKAKLADPKNVKNLYREAQAHIGLNDLVDAASCLWQCAMLQPQTPFFRQEFQKYVELAKQQHKQK